MIVAPEPAALRGWFLPERPGPLVGLHVLNTGHGRCLVDRWPAPRVVVAQAAANIAVLGDQEALSEADVRAVLPGFVDAPRAFEPVLRSAFPTLSVWDRVIAELPGAPLPPPAASADVRPLTADDSPLLHGLEPELNWIWDTWDGGAALAESGYAWGALVDGALRAVACSFFVADHYEDIGVVTEAAFRGRGLSVACAYGLCRDILARGRRPSWSTSPDNVASRRVAEKLGFRHQRDDVLYLAARSAPPPAARS